MGQAINKRPPPASPQVYERHERAHFLRAHAFTLLAGIRADEAAFIAFPRPWFKVSVARDEG